jgi:hypothetical protein
MKWEKLGHIFDPTKIKLPKDCFAFAKSPQAIVFDDYIRIYYCATQKDTQDKLLCRIFYVDFTKDFSKIINHSNGEVISLGALGSFDEHGIFPFNVVKEKDKIRAYTTGWSRRVSVSVETAIGYAESFDGGESFVKNGDGPIVSTNLKEPFLVCDAFVYKENSTFYMFYIFGTKWSEETEIPERVYKIAMATSDDGINWIRNSKPIIQNFIGKDECQALPTVIKINSRYHMYFSYRHMTGFRNQKGKGYQLGYAYSDDLFHWIRDDENKGIELSASGWDSEMMCYPNIFSVDNEVYMLYNGNSFGKYGFGLAKLIDV